MDDLYKTTEEQKIRLYEIAESMRLHGLDSVFIKKAVEVAEYYEGAFELFCLWADEVDENERNNIIDYLKKEIIEFENDRDHFGCLHSSVTLKEVEKKLLDLSFITDSLVCNKCGALLRGKEFEENYNLWLAEKYINYPEKFQLDCFFSDNIIQASNVYLEAYPGTSIDSFMKVLVSIYFNLLDLGKKKPLPVETILNSVDSKIIDKDQDKRKIIIRLKPKLMIEILTIAEVLNLSPSIIVEEVVVKFVTFCNSKDPETIEFWNEEIYEQLDILLKAI